MSRDQRDARVCWTHPLDDELRVVSARAKYDRRFRLVVAQDGDQILREWWPPSSKAVSEASMWLDGYRFAKSVFMGRLV